MLSLRRILFPTDGSDCAERAFGHAAALAAQHHAPLHVLHVLPPAHGPATPLPPRPPVPGVEIIEAEVRATTPLLGVLGYAQEHGVDLIVMGTHARTGLGRLLLGSVAEDVVRLADCPVLTVHNDAPAEAGGHILVPVDFSPDSWLAVAYARHFALLRGARLDLLHVVETLPSYGLVEVPVVFPPVSDAVAEEAHRALRDLAAETEGPDVPVTTHVVAGHPTIGVLETVAALQPDLVVLPTHGRSGLRRLVLGSVAEQVVRRAPCPVLVVRGQGNGLLAAGGDGVAAATPPVPTPTL